MTIRYHRPRTFQTPLEAFDAAVAYARALVEQGFVKVHIKQDLNVNGFSVHTVGSYREFATVADLEA